MHALHRYLTLTPSRLLCVALTDAVGDRLAQNQPGTIDEYPNWRVPLSGPDGCRPDVDRLRGGAVQQGDLTAPRQWPTRWPSCDGWCQSDASGRSAPLRR